MTERKRGTDETLGKVLSESGTIPDHYNVIKMKVSKKIDLSDDEDDESLKIAEELDTEKENKHRNVYVDTSGQICLARLSGQGLIGCHSNCDDGMKEKKDVCAKEGIDEMDVEKLSMPGNENNKNEISADRGVSKKEKSTTSLLHQKKRKTLSTEVTPIQSTGRKHGSLLDAIEFPFQINQKCNASEQSVKDSFQTSKQHSLLSKNGKRLHLKSTKTTKKKGRDLNSASSQNKIVEKIRRKKISKKNQSADSMADKQVNSKKVKLPKKKDTDIDGVPDLPTAISGMDGRLGMPWFNETRNNLPSNNVDPLALSLAAVGITLSTEKSHRTVHGSLQGDAFRNVGSSSCAIDDGLTCDGVEGSSETATFEISPVDVDTSISFDLVGGLDQYVNALKEMVFLPLLYPELFEKFKISPPRGVLLHGHPGTGKTLVARALAAHASRATGGRKVSFFMRKGADILSKWVGESERHLRLLFEEARRRQPSIIFFDEIDGLAPIRSSRSEQIHNSIVSTLLALMDGLDHRGQIVLIGATNRIDSLDSALRRPGRFDRELYFPLPNKNARKEIIQIHTRTWESKPPVELVDELAASTVGYCGADLKALTTEASLCALRRRYPQIYSSDIKLQINPGEVKVTQDDFQNAMKKMTPSHHRQESSYARPLSKNLESVLSPHLDAITRIIETKYPMLFNSLNRSKGGYSQHSSFSFKPFRPRLLVQGQPGCGQGHLAAALLHSMDGLQVYSIGLSNLLANMRSASLEESLVTTFIQAQKAAPSVIYIPRLDLWWENASEILRATLFSLISELPSDFPVIILATSESSIPYIYGRVESMFPGDKSSYTLGLPLLDDRMKYFESLCASLFSSPASEIEDSSRFIEQDPSPPPIAKECLQNLENESSLGKALLQRKLYERDQALLRALRIGLRTVVNQLLNNKKWEAYNSEKYPENNKVNIFINARMCESY